MCEMESCNIVNHNDKEHQLEHILSENLRMMPDKSEEVDKYGLDLRVDPEDDDQLHIDNHTSFISGNTLKPQFKSKLQEHIKKHEISMKEKKRMGLDNLENNETTTEEDSSEMPYGEG